MNLLSFFALKLSSLAVRRLRNEVRQAIPYQQKLFSFLMQKAALTAFGRDHGLTAATTYPQFCERVPVRDYEELRSYFDRVAGGEPDVLWPGKPIYLTKTSGTTSGVKYIPITGDSLPNHIGSMRNALFCYIAEKGNADFLKGKLIFISGSPALERKNGMYVGRLSGIVNHHVPAYLRRHQLPSWETNCLEDFDEKIERIADETLLQDMRMISGIPPWVQMYFERLRERSGKKIGEIFPNFNLFVFGGVNYEPYRRQLEETIGRKVDSIEVYPASEGFIAFQDSQQEKDLLLNVASGLYFEFIEASAFAKPGARRIPLAEVQTGINYVLVLTSLAGLFAYNLGDTVKFTSVDPYRIVVTGRIKHFISAFGEHVIAEEVEKALMETSARHGAHVVEFTVAPQVSPSGGGLPYHEWFIEFDAPPKDITAFSADLDASMQEKNVYYKDLLQGHVLRTLVVRPVSRDSFVRFMRSQGKLGGQNKVPRLSNDRSLVEALLPYVS